MTTRPPARRAMLGVAALVAILLACWWLGRAAVDLGAHAVPQHHAAAMAPDPERAVLPPWPLGAQRSYCLRLSGSFAPCALVEPDGGDT